MTTTGRATCRVRHRHGRHRRRRAGGVRSSSGEAGDLHLPRSCRLLHADAPLHGAPSARRPAAALESLQRLRRAMAGQPADRHLLSAHVADGVHSLPHVVRPLPLPALADPRRRSVGAVPQERRHARGAGRVRGPDVQRSRAVAAGRAEQLHHVRLAALDHLERVAGSGAHLWHRHPAGAESSGTDRSVGLTRGGRSISCRGCRQSSWPWRFWRASRSSRRWLRSFTRSSCGRRARSPRPQPDPRRCAPCSCCRSSTCSSAATASEASSAPTSCATRCVERTGCAASRHRGWFRRACARNSSWWFRTWVWWWCFWRSPESWS